MGMFDEGHIVTANCGCTLIIETDNTGYTIDGVMVTRCAAHPNDNFILYNLLHWISVDAMPKHFTL